MRHFRSFFCLNSLHERRSRNMMARVVRRELSLSSNLIRAVKRSPKTSSREPFVPQTLPPGRTSGRRGGASMVSLPSPIIPVYIPASMSADAVSFPKGVFPPDADFGKGGHVPITHDGSGGCPTLWGDSFEDNYAFGIIILLFLCSRQKSTLLHSRWPSRRQPAKAKELFFKNAFR